MLMECIFTLNLWFSERVLESPCFGDGDSCYIWERNKLAITIVRFDAGKSSYIYMKIILLKLAELMEGGVTPSTDHVSIWTHLELHVLTIGYWTSGMGLSISVFVQGSPYSECCFAILRRLKGTRINGKSHISQFAYLIWFCQHDISYPPFYLAQWFSLMILRYFNNKIIIEGWDSVNEIWSQNSEGILASYKHKISISMSGET